MKPFKSLFLSIFLTTTITQAQWEVQLDIQNFCHLDRIFFIDENYGWAIGGSTLGTDGPYYYTTDGGEHWYLDGDWWDIQGTDIVFVNHDTGFIAASDGVILKTINGGQTWTEIQTPATQDVTRLFFVDENNGWATLGSYDEGNILHTENNGDNWVLQSFIESNISANVYSIYFMNENNGWGGYSENGTDYCVLKYTTNKGETWLTKYTSISQLFWFIDIYFIDSLNGWVVGQNCSLSKYLILHSEDAGETWEEQSIQGNNPPYCVHCVYFVDDTTGWIGIQALYPSSYYGGIYFTDNGGQDWQLQQEFANVIYDIQMLNHDTGWAVGADFIYHTTNGGTVGLHENHLEKNFIRINPNPFKNTIYLQAPDEYQITEIIITDYTGKICLLINENIRNDIDLSFLQSGIYLLQVQFDLLDQTEILTTKIIKL